MELRKIEGTTWIFLAMLFVALTLVLTALNHLIS